MLDHKEGGVMDDKNGKEGREKGERQLSLLNNRTKCPIFDFAQASRLRVDLTSSAAAFAQVISSSL